MGEIAVNSLDRKLIEEMFLAFDALRRNGWQEAIYAPFEATLEFIVAGSTGVFRGQRGRKDGLSLEGFWIEYNGDLEPCSPILFRRLPQ